MTFHRDDPNTWPVFKPLIIAHDVGRSRDRSTAVVGGLGPFEPTLIGIKEAEELPQGLYGSRRASALAAIDRRYNNNALIVADLSYDPTYAEVLFETFGPRVIGLTISRNGDGMNGEWASGQTWGDVVLHRWPLLSPRTLSFLFAISSGQNCPWTVDPTRT